MARFITKHFKEDHYSVIFNPDTGFFARKEDEGYPDPFWAPHGPELLDIAITNWCDRGCSFCYRKSDISGQHMSLEDYRKIMTQARSMHVFQVALGGGNPNQHPEFADFLRITREEFGIVPNYTTNGRGLTETVLTATKQYCGAVAVSAYEPYNETAEAISLLNEYGIQVNLHFILGNNSIDKAINWLNLPPSFLKKINAIVFLNYKPVGRNTRVENLLNKSDKLEEFFDLATKKAHPFKIGFDSCMITGLARLGSAPAISIDGCDAARFSLFVSENLDVYPCSYMVETDFLPASLHEGSLFEIWKDGKAFKHFRDKHSGNGCSDCSTPNECLGGCPLFPNMNLCAEKCNK